tara:strand:+ start:519 stop:893 length:375 start_codon:yes stop_codon:yes gene_type:complete
MLEIIAVGLGGFIGAISRYLIGVSILRNYSGFPTHTLFVNTLGCLFFGIIINHSFSSQANLLLRKFIIIGALGGFTTFSTFSYEFLNFIQNNQIQIAIIYIILSIILGSLAIFAGIKLNQIYSN